MVSGHINVTSAVILTYPDTRKLCQTVAVSCIVVRRVVVPLVSRESGLRVQKSGGSCRNTSASELGCCNLLHGKWPQTSHRHLPPGRHLELAHFARALVQLNDKGGLPALRQKNWAYQRVPMCLIRVETC